MAEYLDLPASCGSRRIRAERAGDGLRRRRVLPGPDRQGGRALRPLGAEPLGAEPSLPDGNTRVSYLALVEFPARNRVEWKPPSVEETVAVIEGVAAGKVTERELADWLRASQAGR